ncbi:2-succinyl-6-hydroxy-2,4-cyclohexadiene-1-carboxylate synthase [candidate division KSB1 bacterium]
MEKFRLFNFVIHGIDNRENILFLHGFMGAGEDWHVIIDGLKNNFNCITIDLPGHGQNLPEKITNYTFEGCTDNIMSLINDMGIDECHIAGYSMGGRIGLHLLADFPERFGKIILESVNPGIESGKAREQRIENDRITAERIVTGDLVDFLTGWYSQPFFGRLNEHVNFPDLMNKRLKNDREGLSNSLNYMSTGKQKPFWNRIPEIENRILYIAGSLDDKYVTIGKKLSELNRNIKFAITENAGHNTHFQEPEIYIEKVKEFLLEQED